MALEISTLREDGGAGAGTAASKLHHFDTLVGVGLATSSMAITLLAVREPPLDPGENAYLLALTGAFFAGVAEIIVAVVCVSNNPRGGGRRRSAGANLTYAASVAVAALAVVGLSVASLLW